MDRLLHQDNEALDQNLFSEGGLDGCSILTISDLHRWDFLFTAFTVATQGLILPKLTEGYHQEWSLELSLTQHGKTHQVQA